MKHVVFKWIEEDGPNQQVCSSYDEVVEFCELNDHKTFTVSVWSD